MESGKLFSNPIKVIVKHDSEENWYRKKNIRLSRSLLVKRLTRD